MTAGRLLLAPALAMVAFPALFGDARASGDIIPRATGLNSAVGLARAGDGSNRVFVVEQDGCIRFYLDGAIVGAPCGAAGTRFLDIRARVQRFGERGLLGLAFHPQFAANRFFFVFYTSAGDLSPPVRLPGDIVIARYSMTSDPDIADPSSERILIVIPHSEFQNHNGGHMAFGPDAFLYAAVGDGGGFGDPGENAQDTTSMLGKIHRIDVDEGSPPFYRIPPTNPFVSGGPGTCGPQFPGSPCDEIWAYGLRNPWSFGFDRQTGDLYIADVGQDSWEEINFQPANAAGGRNYGWDVLEGGLHGSGQVPAGNCYEDLPAGSCVALINGGGTPPILEYDHDSGTAVVGGPVYRGLVNSPVWTGSYMFADIYSGRVWRGFQDQLGNDDWQMQQMFAGIHGITSFAEDDRGSVYLITSDTIYQFYPWSATEDPPGLALGRPASSPERVP